MREKDKDVKKAVSWALREITKKNEDAVFEFLWKWADVKDKSTMQIIRDRMKKLSSEKARMIKLGLKRRNGNGNLSGWR